MITIHKVEGASVENIKYIIHVADIHIRLQKRHEEYRTVFSRLYSYCKDFKAKNPNTIIYVAGDIAHSKTDMSPEQINLIQDFFRSLADITDTIVITGNHDMNLNNKTRLDALEPIINAIKHPNLFYLKDTGVYEFNNVYFNVMGVADKPVSFIRGNQIPNDKIKIALHHGAVNQASTDAGFQLTNDLVNTDTFADHAITLLGDIHKFQYLNANKTIAYASSLIQQNFGETLNFHGLLVWDIETCESKFVEVENDYGYITLEATAGLINSYPDKFPKKARVKLKLQNTTSSQLKTLVADLKSKYNVLDIVTQKVKDFHKDSSNITKISLGNVRDIEYQNSLITEYLVNKLDIDEDSMLDGVRHINRIINSKLQSIDTSKNITYNLGKFEFSNMFSYGENNVIDFNQMNGIYGLFASNRAGKSSLLDSLLYCIFDKSTKTDKASYVLNNKKTTFKCKLELDINNKKYFIERSGVKNKTGHVKVTVNFYSVDDLGNITSLNGQERDDTNSIIRSYVGTYKDFILTSVITQNNSSGFIEMSQKERKDLLSQFLDINIFDDLQRIAADEIKDVLALLKDYQKRDFSSKIADSDKAIKSKSSELKKYKSQKDIVETDITKTDAEIFALAAKLIPLSITNYDINSLELKKKDIYQELEGLKSNLTALNGEITSFNDHILTLIEEVNTYDTISIESSLNALNTNIQDRKSIETEIQIKEVELSHVLDKMGKLNDLEYDESCNYCMNNIFVKDAIQTKENIHIHHSLIDDLTHNKDILLEQETVLLPYVKLSDEYKSALSKKQSYEKLKSAKELEIERLKSKVVSLVTEYNSVDFSIDEYNKNKDSVEYNLDLNKEINSYKLLLKDKKSEVSLINSFMATLSTEIELAKKDKDLAIENIDQLKNLEQEYRFYELYLSATNRNGVPYDLICKVMPQIEQEINNVLGQIVDFSIMLQTDEKNINAFIVYDDDNYWPLDLTSGMERFISSLAIRSSLINITSLPKPNCIAIDEGFTQLDAENMGQVYLLFNYLKTQFDFMMVISHIDVMRDMVEHFIDIKKEDGFSKVSIM